jgi:hypothetical protein
VADTHRALCGRPVAQEFADPEPESLPVPEVAGATGAGFFEGASDLDDDASLGGAVPLLSDGDPELSDPVSLLGGASPSAAFTPVFFRLSFL